MENLYEPSIRDAVVHRLSTLQSTSPRQWGKMDVAQMMAHCAVAFEVPVGDRLAKQALLGKIVTPLLRGRILGEKPLGRNSPTDPVFRIVDKRDFARERQRLSALMERFCSRGREASDGVVHSFFGRLSGEDWGRLMYKHMDHHLRQFGA